MIKTFWNSIRFVSKVTILFVSFWVFFISFMLSVEISTAASLKNVSVVHEDTLKLGDLFDNLSRNADYVIGVAPQPGEDMVLNARTLYRIAVALDLPWKPKSNGDHVIIRREATIVPYEVIEQSLKSALNEKGVSGNFSVALNNGKPSLTLPNDLPQSAEIKSMSFNPQKDYFIAQIVSPSLDNPLKKISVSGMVERLVEVPVLRSNLRNGDIIGKNDIDLMQVPQKQLQHNIILDAKDLIGMTPRRMAYAGKFIMAGQLERPQLVERGERVNIIYKSGPLTLTAKGRALQSGAKGDLVRISNLNSSRNIDALVTGENLVVVQ
ncbi:MAG: flagellar basal body P-ring formation chaperone FlgA [Alphaproteobacteria bacterium]|nr:flagellar basal body P-ring formation chaperone FlgA [Alphaproteobacteria bacterium]